MNTKIILLLAGLLAVASLPAHAFYYDEYAGYSDFSPDSTVRADNFEVMARVISAEPMYEMVTIRQPVTECWTERHARPAYQPDHRVTSSVIGGILGGVAGHQVGNGRGRDAATVAGSLLGAAIGYNMGSRRGYHDQEVCETIDRPRSEERVTGYRVEYYYEDQVFVTHTDTHPGQWIRLKVNVKPT